LPTTAKRMRKLSLSSSTLNFVLKKTPYHPGAEFFRFRLGKREPLCYTEFKHTEEKCYDKDPFRMPRQYMNTKGILIEPQ